MAGGYSSGNDCGRYNVFGKNNFLFLGWERIYFRESAGSSIYYDSMGAFGRRNRLAGVFGSLAQAQRCLQRTDSFYCGGDMVSVALSLFFAGWNSSAGLAVLY